LFERPQKSRATDFEMLGPDAIAHVPSTKLDQIRRHLLQAVQAIYSDLHRGHQPSRLGPDVLPEEATGLGSQFEDAPVQELAGNVGDRENRLKRRLDQFNLL
jgi:hypothetical protein